MQSDYVHLSYPPTSGWVIRLVNVLLNSRPEFQERLTAWWSREGVGDVALALASKLEMLRIATRRLDERLRLIGKELLDNQDEFLICASNRLISSQKKHDNHMNNYIVILLKLI